MVQQQGIMRLVGIPLLVFLISEQNPRHPSVGVVTVVRAFVGSSQSLSLSLNNHLKTRTNLKVPSSLQAIKTTSKKKRRCNPCSNPYDDDKESEVENETNEDATSRTKTTNIGHFDDESRREALFAMVGQFWAMGMIPSSVVWATTGQEANLQLPNPLQSISDRTNKQCLVESLGNRECLVYLEDQDQLLYQGVDVTTLLQRIYMASQAWATIPSILEVKQPKWNQVTSILTGPMGELVQTMTQLVKASSSSSTSSSSLLTKGLKAFKEDLYGLNMAIEKRNASLALQYHNTATQHLIQFVQQVQ